MSAGTRCSASHPILAIRSCFNLEGYSVGVVLCFFGFGPPSSLLRTRTGAPCGAEIVVFSKGFASPMRTPETGRQTRSGL